MAAAGRRQSQSEILIEMSFSENVLDPSYASDFDRKCLLIFEIP
jgi:hypothetical protein